MGRALRLEMVCFRDALVVGLAKEKINVHLGGNGTLHTGYPIELGSTRRTARAVSTRPPGKRRGLFMRFFLDM